MSRFNFKGWELTEWFLGNGKTIKELVKVLIPWFAASFIVDPVWQQFVLTIAGKFVLDSVHYFVKE